MSKLPPLLKPFYTIEETFKRLNLVGANLDKVNDILLLATQNQIEISLLLDQDAVLIKKGFAKPFRSKKSLGFNPDQDDINFMINGLGDSENDVRCEISILDNPKLMIPNHLSKGDPDRTVKEINFEWIRRPSDENEQKEKIKNRIKEFEKDMGALGVDEYIKSFIRISSAQPPIVVSPMRVSIDHKTGQYSDPKPYNFLVEELFDPLHESIALLWNGDIYYTCQTIHGSYLSEMIEYEVKFENGNRYIPIYRLDSRLVFNLIHNHNYVVTKANLEAFEQTFLGIEHGVNLRSYPECLNPNSDFYARELAIAVQAHEGIFINNFGNAHDFVSHRVESWLTKNYPDESDAFYKRIKTVVLPKKKVT